jgi:uncharacterized membrane protein YfhO
MNTDENKFLIFLKKHKEYFILLGTVFVIFVCMLAIGGCFPFGDKTLLASDANAQIGAFFEYWFKVFRGEASLFYTSTLGGGVEIFSTIEYMLLSPFYLVCFLGGEANCYGMFNIAILLMLLFNAFVFVWFAKKHFKNINLTILTLLGLLFVFSGATLLNYSFVTWLIFPALLLLLLDAFKSLVEQKKILRFTLILIWYVVNCFSVGVFTNITLVVLFFLFIMFMVEKQDRKGAFVRLFVSYLIAILVAATILFPSIMAMLSSGRGTNFFARLKTLKAINLNNFDGILIDSIFLIFGGIEIASIFKNEKCSNRFKFCISSFCLLIFPCIFNLSLNLLCGGVYAGFSNRFYFLMLDFLLILTLQFFSKEHALEEAKSSPLFKAIFVAIMVLTIAIVLIVEIFKGEALSRTIKNPTTITSNLPLFCFAFFVIFALVIFFVWFFNKRKQLSQKIVKIGVIFVMVVSIVVNFFGFAFGTMISTSKKNELTNFVSSQNLSGRIKEFKLSMGDMMLVNSTSYGMQNLSFFSSLISNETETSFSKLGYYNSAVSVLASQSSGTLITDALVGLNYYVSSEEQDRPYLTLVEKSENFYLYKNELATTGAILFDENYSYDNNLSVLENQELIAQSFGISDKLFSDVEFDIKDMNDHFDEVSAVKQITFTATEDGILYFNSDLKKLDKEKQASYSYENVYLSEIEADEFYDFKFMKAGETETFVVFFNDESDYLSAKFLSYDAAEKVCNKLKENEVEFSSNKDGYVVSGTTDETKKLIIFSPNIKGMNYSLNGAIVEAENEIGYFASVVVEAGEINLVATYSYPYAKLWLLIFGLCIVAVVAIALIYHYTKFRHIETAIYVAFWVVCALILSIFYLFGLFLTFFRFLL